MYLRGRILLFLLMLTVISVRPIRLFSKDVPYLSSRVNDYATILSPETIQRLEQTLKEHEDSTSNQIVILTVQSLEGEVLEEFSIRVVDKWKLGTKKNDNGVLLLIAKEERKVRIEVGDGLEGVLTDGICGAIIRHQIVPFFKEDRYDEGVERGVNAVLKAIRFEYKADEEPAESTDDSLPLPDLIAISAFFLLVVGLFTVLGVFTKGSQSWFMFFFLIPFWTAFPMALYGVTVGLIILGGYVLFYLCAKTYLAKTTAGELLFDKWSKTLVTKSGSSSYSSGSGWSSSSDSSWSSSSDSSFSGGGGSFSGGGASGSW
ncbi:MAG: TPM domain-containing protein [Bacteroidota bacterium]